MGGSPPLMEDDFWEKTTFDKWNFYSVLTSQSMAINSWYCGRIVFMTFEKEHISGDDEYNLNQSEPKFFHWKTQSRVRALSPIWSNQRRKAELVEISREHLTLHLLLFFPCSDKYFCITPPCYDAWKAHQDPWGAWRCCNSCSSYRAQA